MLKVQVYELQQAANIVLLERDQTVVMAILSVFIFFFLLLFQLGLLTESQKCKYKETNL